ncbi:MAG: 4'-phosphopantetheinyl transferase superfamily protein [Candidatus Saccharibacteria bacterium]|nr:4'-phosphopantetheinyl transferase superfamily protein [Moraxellaceae bacterium]
MNIVDQWLPKNVYCYSQVFCTDDYAEIMNLSPDLALNMKSILPEALVNTSQARQVSYLAGRGCALSALKMAGDVPRSTLGRTSKGLLDWPQRFVGSISHAMVEGDGVAIAVVARSNEHQSIAIDCEPVFTLDHANEIALLTASENELRLGERLGFSRELWLTMVYSLKETLFKLLYSHVNCFMPFEAAEILSFDVETGQACLMLSVDWGDLPVGQRYWLQLKDVEVDRVGRCVVSFGAE